MSGRFSFDGDDEASFAPRHTNSNPQQQFQSARGREHEPSANQQYVSPIAYHDQHSLVDTSYNNARADPFQDAARDPHNIAAVPPPPPHRRMSSSDSYGRNAAYGTAAVGAAGAGLGAAAGAAMDTAYHGAGDDGYHDYQPYNPFDHAETSYMQPPARSYPEYPSDQPIDDPFASHRNSYNDLAPPNAAYEMQQRPDMFNRPSSFGSPYGGYDHAANTGDLGSFDPRDIADEDDDTGALAAKQTSRGPAAAGIAGAAGGAAGAGALMKGIASRDASGRYNAVPGGGGGGSGPEKANIVGKASNRKRSLWIIGAVIGVIIVLAIVGGVLGSYLYQHRNQNSTGGTSGGVYDANSKEIKKLMNNKNLHKVFSGVDYTSWGMQYPDCLSNPPDQNNVTMDVAVLSQMTPVIRLYGTDCNQTEMVLTAIDKLDLKNDIKVWLGVYLNGNQTTNTRQIQQMWDVLGSHGTDPFQGVIVGNEVLFSNYMPEQDLTDLLDETRKNLTAKNYKLPLACSDIGDQWNDTLAQHVDYVMANVHPFFAGVAVDQAADWTYNYWQTKDVGTTKNLPGKTQVVSEIGWPSEGGQYCTNEQTGLQVPCPNAQAGAIASISGINTLMNDWVCQALQNGTQYFWFEAFDQPWQAQFNKPGENWEDKWGLMDPARNIKPGVTIPDCGGKTASLPS